jgi:glyoxylase-like metal-dependent hydrolase (beta-lactamase superfamily II)
MHLRRFLAAAASAVIALACTGLARSSPVDGVLQNAARALGVDHIRSLEYEAAGRYYQFTQAPAPDLPWPPFEVRDYVATLDYERGAVHAKYHRVQVQEPGRARPHAEAIMDQFARDGVSWNVTPQSMGSVATAMPGNLVERNAELWASPQGFIKAALTHGAKLTPHKGGGAIVAFTLEGKYRYEGVVNGAGQVLRVKSFMDSSVLGDTPIEFIYSNYRDFGGVKFPARIERRVADLPWYELDVSAVRVNVAKPFPVPAVIAANPAPAMTQIEVGEVAPGVLRIGGGSHNSVVVEQRRGLVVIEAPLSEERSEAVLAKIHELYPGTSITAVINTHAHFDHAGGLRTYVDQGIPVITHVRNVPYYQRVWAAPRTLNPDRLAKSARAPVFRAVDGMLELDDDVQPVEIHAIRDSGHNDAFVMIWLPRHRVLVEADAWTPTPPGAAPPAQVNPLWINLDANIRRLALDVERIVPLHGSAQTYAALRQAIQPGEQRQ